MKDSSVKILLHINESKKEKQILRLCDSLNWNVKKLRDTDAGSTVGNLSGLGSTAFKSQSDVVPSSYSLPDVIIFCGVASDDMDIFLKKYKESGIAPTGLKAAVTVHNAGWSLYRLIEELKKEQTAFLMKNV